MSDNISSYREDNNGYLKPVAIFDGRLHVDRYDRNEKGRTYLHSITCRLATRTKLKKEPEKIRFCINYLEGHPRKLAQVEFKKGTFTTLECFVDWFTHKYLIPEEEEERSVYVELTSLNKRMTLAKALLEIEDLWNFNKTRPDKVSEAEFMAKLVSFVDNPNWESRISVHKTLSEMIEATQSLLDAEKRNKHTPGWRKSEEERQV